MSILEYLEQEISVGGKRLTLLRFILFVGSAVGLFLSLTFEIIRLLELSDIQAVVGVNGAFPGWIGNRWRDHNDDQWNNWIETLPTLFFTFIPFLSASAFIRYMIERRGWAKETQIKFYFVTGLIGGFFINGTEVLFPLFYISLNYLIIKSVRRLPEGLAIWIIWISNIIVLVSIYTYPYPQINTLFPFMKTITFGYVGFSRWSIYYKLAMLRLISFGIDFQQAYRKNQKPSESPLTSSASTSRYELAELRQFNFVSLVAYTFYLPLMIAGPIAPFSQFARDCEQRQTQVPLRSILWMFAQVTFYTLAMEVWIHYVYVYSWNFYGNWEDFSSGMLSMICFWTLHHMYVKFTVIWRAFRALALLDGISVTENMQKCISNTNSFQGFWRCWHSSFSEWLMRYIYIPLGGRKHRVISLWLIFIFVGAWHDLDYNWMSFSIFNAAGITIESLMREWVYNSGQKWINTSRSSWTIRFLEVSVGAMNVALLTLSNFAINQGFQKMKDFVWHAYFKDANALWTLFWSWSYLMMVTTQFYANPWNAANEENKPQKKLRERE